MGGRLMHELEGRQQAALSLLLGNRQEGMRNHSHGIASHIRQGHYGSSIGKGAPTFTRQEQLVLSGLGYNKENLSPEIKEKSQHEILQDESNNFIGNF